LELLERLGFERDEEEKSYTIIDYRGTHKVTTYCRGDFWVTITETVKEDNDELLPPM
jgi:hypothetical protein